MLLKCAQKTTTNINDVMEVSSLMDFTIYILYICNFIFNAELQLPLQIALELNSN